MYLQETYRGVFELFHALSGLSTDQQLKVLQEWENIRFTLWNPFTTFNFKHKIKKLMGSKNW